MTGDLAEVGKDRKYWAFISYSSKDRRWAAWLRKSLEAYVLPQELQGSVSEDGREIGKFLRPIFRDRDELSGAAELGTSLERALASSEYLVVLCSPNSARSKWVDLEIVDFVNRGKQGNILALIVDGEPNATSQLEIPSELECFPPSLRYPLEPLAGDLRRSGDGKERGLLKIVSGLTGLSFESLYRRHERARRKRLTIAALIVSVVMLSLIGLTIFAFAKERQATMSAEAERKAREASDDLVAFMVEDLYEELRRTGRLDVLTSTVEKVQTHQDQNESSLKNRLRLGKNQMSVLFETGKTEEAIQLAGRLLKEADGSLEVAEEKAALQLSLSDYLGWTSDGLEKAVTYATIALRYYEDDNEAVEQRALALNYRADAYRDLGETKNAIIDYQRAIDLYRSHPDFVGHVIPRTYDRLGEVYLQTGKIEESQRSFKAACDAALRGENLQRGDQEWRCDYALALAKVASPESQKKAHEILEELVKLDYSNARWRLELAKVKALYAGSELSELSVEEREYLSEESQSLLESLIRSNRQQPIWLQSLANVYLKKGVVCEDSACFREVLELCEEQPDNAVMAELACEACVQLVWNEKEVGEQIRFAKIFFNLWDRLPEAKRRTSRNKNAFCLMCLEEASLLKKHDLDQNDRVVHLVKNAKAMIESLKEDGVDLALVADLESQLTEVSAP